MLESFGKFVFLQRWRWKVSVRVLVVSRRVLLVGRRILLVDHGVFLIRHGVFYVRHGRTIVLERYALSEG